MTRRRFPGRRTPPPLAWMDARTCHPPASIARIGATPAPANTTDPRPAPARPDAHGRQPDGPPPTRASPTIVRPRTDAGDRREPAALPRRGLISHWRQPTIVSPRTDAGDHRGPAARPRCGLDAHWRQPEHMFRQQKDPSPPRQPEPGRHAGPPPGIAELHSARGNPRPGAILTLRPANAFQATKGNKNHHLAKKCRPMSTGSDRATRRPRSTTNIRAKNVDQCRPPTSRRTTTENPNRYQQPTGATGPTSPPTPSGARARGMSTFTIMCRPPPAAPPPKIPTVTNSPHRRDRPNLPTHAIRRPRSRHVDFHHHVPPTTRRATTENPNRYQQPHRRDRPNLPTHAIRRPRTLHVDHHHHVPPLASSLKIPNQSQPAHLQRGNSQPIPTRSHQARKIPTFTNSRPSGRPHAAAHPACTGPPFPSGRALLGWRPGNRP
jgi:hypothetical protein